MPFIFAAVAHAAKVDKSPDTAIPDLMAQIAPLLKAALSLPIGTALGAALAFRPRLRGTPPRNPGVVHTQILLALVGTLVMLVVGSSLARAFGIVGAAGLVRYRAKIEDPKDAGVMLASLTVGLASGAGLYLLAGFATLCTLAVLLGVESLGPDGFRLFELTVTSENGTPLRNIEKILRRHHVEYELRSTGNKEVCYEVRLPYDSRTDHLAEEVQALDKNSGMAVKWEEKKPKANAV